MICVICHARPVRPRIGRGPVPTRCRECYHAKTRARREEKIDLAAQRILARLAGTAQAVRALPRNFCRCAAPIVWREGPLTVCRLCSREMQA